MNKKKGPFKMKLSTFKQKEHLTAGETKAQEKFTQTVDQGASMYFASLGKDKYKKPAKNILSKMWRGGSRVLGALAVPELLYSFHQSGQKHSDGKVRKDQKSFMAESKKKTKSIFNKKKKK